MAVHVERRVKVHEEAALPRAERRGEVPRSLPQPLEVLVRLCREPPKQPPVGGSYHGDRLHRKVRGAWRK